MLTELKILKRVFILISASLFLVFSAYAQKVDKIELINGDKITGEVKNLKVGILNFKTDNMETVGIKWDKIKSIYTKNLYEIELDDGRVYFGSIEPSNEAGLLIIKGVTLEYTLFMKYIVRIDRIKDSFWDILDGYLKFGFSFTKASKIGQLSLGSNARYKTKNNLTELTLNSILTTTSKEPTSRKQDLTLNYQQNLSDNWFAGGLTSLESNTELGVKLRTSLGAGAGNNLIQSDKQYLYTLAGLSVNRELKIDQSKSTYNLEGIITAQYQFFKYDHPKANLLTYFNLLPSITDFGRIRLNYNLQLSWEIFLDFYWDMTFYLEYDNRPQSSNAAQADYRIDSTIKYEF